MRLPKRFFLVLGWTVLAGFCLSFAQQGPKSSGSETVARPRKKDAPVFERTFYNNEVLAITQDFVRVGGHPRVSSNL